MVAAVNTLLWLTCPGPMLCIKAIRWACPEWVTARWATTEGKEQKYSSIRVTSMQQERRCKSLSVSNKMLHSASFTLQAIIRACGFGAETGLRFNAAPTSDGELSSWPEVRGCNCRKIDV